MYLQILFSEGLVLKYCSLVTESAPIQPAQGDLQTLFGSPLGWVNYYIIPIKFGLKSPETSRQIW